MTVSINNLSDLLNLPGFREDMEGPRTRGSTTERGIRTLTDRPVEEFRPTVANVAVARYFSFDASELGGRLGVKRLLDLTPDRQQQVRARGAGDHGIELYLDVDPSDADLPPAEIGVAIIGPIDDKGTIGWWTWYVSDEATKTVGCLIARKAATDHPASSLGIKLHNGS